VVEPLTRGTTNLTISDGPTTPFHRPDLASPTPDEANPNPNGLGSSSPLWMSPLGNFGHPSGDPVTHLNPYPTGRRPPKRHHRCTSLSLNGATSPVHQEMGRGWVGKSTGRMTEQQGWRWWWGIKVGVLTRRLPAHMVDLERQERRRQRGGETKDRLSHRCKRGGKRPVS
jgi:hypothetical protein